MVVGIDRRNFETTYNQIHFKYSKAMKPIYKMLTGTSFPGVTVGLIVLYSININAYTDTTKLCPTHHYTCDNVIKPMQAPDPAETRYLPLLSAVVTLK